MGQHGLELIKAARKSNAPINILTHCNAGWLAAVDIGLATAPIYTAHDAGIPVHVWVDETRPRNQDASLTAFSRRTLTRARHAEVNRSISDVCPDHCETQ